MPRAFYRARCWSVDVYKRMWWLLINAGWAHESFRARE